MTNALGAEVERSPDRLGRAGLAGVRGQAQALVGGIGVDAAEKFRRGLQFVAANADTDDMAVPVASGEFENFLRFLDSEVAGGVEDPKQRNAEIARAAGAAALQTLEDGGEILLAEKADADGNVDLGVQHVLFFQPLHQTVGNEFVVVRAAQVRADRLEGHQKTLEIGVAVEGFDLGESGVLAVELAQLEKRGGLDRALEMQVQLRFRKLTDEGIGRAIYCGGHGCDCRFLREDLRENGKLWLTIFPLQCGVLKIR